MKINKLNYENYVIDYIEGTLSTELKKDFDLFLEKNEEVYEEIKDYISAPTLEESSEVYDDKKLLKKSEGFNPYYLLALIPIFLIGAYFFSSTNEPIEKQEIKSAPVESVRQFAQEKVNEKLPTKKVEPVKKNTKQTEAKLEESNSKEVKMSAQKQLPL